jgi:hypothetical protein
MKLKTRALFLLIITIGFVLVAQSSSAQETGKLHGKIVDAVGAVISKAPVTIRNSMARHEIVTDDNGEFEIALPAGVYGIRTEEMPGFLRSRDLKVRVRRDQERRVTIAVMHTLKGAWCVLRITSH